MQYFKDADDVKVALVLSNNPNAGGLQIAEKYGVATAVVTREQFNDSEYLLPLLEQHQLDLIVLAGFLWLVPGFLVEAFPHKIVNIHPALLPNYGGKGMYGANVHKAVVAAKEKESGITIHYVDSRYDEGRIIHQANCSLQPDETPESLSKKVLQLEHEWYPKVIRKVLEEQKKN